jgi:transketolase
MAHDGKEGHLSSALSPVDILVALYWNWLHITPTKAPGRDRFLLSKGHGCASLYAILAEKGVFPLSVLATYNQENSALPNHPCVHALPVLETSSGSLGHGLGIATGMVYGMRLKQDPGRVVVLLGDGECNEGSVWESAMFAAAHGMDRLLGIVDYNGIQAVGRSDEIMGHTRLEDKFRSFGWSARAIDGSNMDEIVSALSEVPFETGKPTAIVAHTRAGVSFMNDDVLWHYRKPTDEELRQALQELDVQSIYVGSPHA